MATRFAVASTNWNTPSTWDNGAVPLAGDTVYPNGYGVTIDTDISVASLNNNATFIKLPNMEIPLMTGNSQPSGMAFSGGNALGFDPYLAFDQSTGTIWKSSTNNTGSIGYQYPVQKIIRRYFFNSAITNQGTPASWNFQGSNDGIIWTNIESPTGNISSTYTSGVLSNTTAYFYYRINVLSVVSANNIPQLATFEMTESVGTQYGQITGGSFTVPASLSGTRNIVQTGAGIISNNAATVMTLAHTTGNTVNFNISSGGYILNPNSHTGNFNNSAIQLNGNGAVNFNGNIWGSQTIGITNVWGLIYINNNATVTINGNLYAGKGGTSTYKLITTAVTTSNSCVLNINGDIIGSNYFSASYPIAAESLATTNITGNLTADLGNCYYSLVASFLNLTGTATVTNANSQAAIVMTSATSLLTINGSITNKNNVNAIVASKIRFASTATPYWIYQTNGASDITLAYGAATGAYPAEADVKLGVAYAASPTRYGTCAVPLPQYVSQGVATGSTVGTAYINAADVWNVLSSSITTAGSIGERLKVASTVETTGDQLAAYIV